MSHNQLKFILYARKSTDDDKNKSKRRQKQILSIDSQLTELREFAVRQGYFVIEEIIEHQTAKRPGRPEFNRMMKAIAQGKADGILAWHPDRLARNSKDGGEIIHQIDQGTLKDLKFPAYTFENSPQGKFMLYLTFAQSKLYVDNMSINTIRNHREKMRRGEWPFPAPIGYVNNSETQIVEIDPATAPVIAKAFEFYARGTHAVTDIRKFMNDGGLRSRFKKNPLSLSHCHLILRNPFYYGLMRMKGELYPGKHAPLISKTLFDRVQNELTRRSKPNERRLKPFLYRGMFRCGECGCTITAETQKGINYLRCTKRVIPCSQPYMREQELEKQLLQTIERIRFPSRVIKILQRVILEKRSEIKKANDEQIALLSSKLKQAEERKDKLLDFLLTEDMFSQEDYRSKANQLTGEIVTLTEKINRFRKDSDKRFEPWTDLENGLNQAIILSKEQNPEKIRDFVKNTGSNFRIQNRRMEVELKKRWKIVADWKTRLAGYGPNPSAGKLVTSLCIMLDEVRTE